MSELREAITKQVDRAFDIVGDGRQYESSALIAEYTDIITDEVLDAVIVAVRNNDTYEDGSNMHPFEYWSGMTAERLRILKELEAAKEGK